MMQVVVVLYTAITGPKSAPKRLSKLDLLANRKSRHIYSAAAVVVVVVVVVVAAVVVVMKDIPQGLFYTDDWGKSQQGPVWWWLPATVHYSTVQYTFDNIFSFYNGKVSEAADDDGGGDEDEEQW